jgi:hypothetical protein
MKKWWTKTSLLPSYLLVRLYTDILIENLKEENSQNFLGNLDELYKTF